MSELTPWFPFSTPPVRHGVYNVSCRDGNQSGKWYGCFRDGKWSYWVCDNRGKDRAIREASRASYLERAPTYGTWRGLSSDPSGKEKK